MAISKAEVQTEQSLAPHVTARDIADVMITGYGDAVDAADREHLQEGDR